MRHVIHILICAMKEKVGIEASCDDPFSMTYGTNIVVMISE